MYLLSRGNPKRFCQICLDERFFLSNICSRRSKRNTIHPQATKKERLMPPPRFLAAADAGRLLLGHVRRPTPLPPGTRPRDYTDRILTPKPPATPRINGPNIYGQRPGRPFLYTIPATGDRPMKFAADNLPEGLKVDEKTGRITGKVEKAGQVRSHAPRDERQGRRTRKSSASSSATRSPSPRRWGGTPGTPGPRTSTRKRSSPPPRRWSTRA